MQEEHARRASQRDLILRELRFYGKVSNLDLGKISYRYGARIYELRKQGYDIMTGKIEAGITHYELLKEPDGTNTQRLVERDRPEGTTCKV